VFQRSSPLKLFRLFLLRLSLFAWNFANLLAIHIHIYLPFLYIYLNTASNGVNFSMSTHRFNPLSFEYSPRKWKCSVSAFWKWCHFFVVASRDGQKTDIIAKNLRVLVFDNCKRSTTVWFFTINTLTIYWGKIVLTVHADVSWARTWCESHHFQLPWQTVEVEYIVKKSAVESTALAQPFCVNQSVGVLT